MTNDKMVQLAINTIRTLSIDGKDWLCLLI